MSSKNMAATETANPTPKTEVPANAAPQTEAPSPAPEKRGSEKKSS